MQDLREAISPRRAAELQRQLMDFRRREENFQGQLREMQEREQDLQRQLREFQERDQNSAEFQQREENSQREMRQRERNLQSQLRELREREQNSQRLLTEFQQREENSQRELREMRQRERNLQSQLRELQEREQNSQRHLTEFQQREENSQRELREIKQRERNLQSQLRQLQEREENSQRHPTEFQQREANSQRQLTETRQLTEFQQREENSQRQLSETRQQLINCQEQVAELQLSLSTAQLTINQLRSQETRDWVIPRDEIQITEKCLGRGGWGSVNEGTYCGCTVAVKEIYELILSPHNIPLFEREMNVASKCRHPQLVQFIGATNDEGTPLIVTELMEKSLRTLLEQRQLSETEIAIISLDVARALNYLHQKKPGPIIHRDVSSAKVLLWRQGDQWRGKVSDHGSAYVIQQTMTLAPGAMIYNAPEALTSNQTVKVSFSAISGLFTYQDCTARLRVAEVKVTLVLSPKLTFLSNPQTIQYS